jgi:hypothetical protein
MVRRTTVMDEEALRALLEHKLSFLETVAQTTMAWWVSSIVFCATVIAIFWGRRQDVVMLPGLNIVCSLVSVFLFSFPVYAAWVIYGTHRIHLETQDILLQLGLPTDLLFEFTGVKVAVSIGGTVFVLMFLTWIYVWRRLNEYGRGTDATETNTKLC